MREAVEVSNANSSPNSCDSDPLELVESAPSSLLVSRCKDWSSTSADSLLRFVGLAMIVVVDYKEVG